MFFILLLSLSFGIVRFLGFRVFRNGRVFGIFLFFHFFDGGFCFCLESFIVFIFIIEVFFDVDESVIKILFLFFLLLFLLFNYGNWTPFTLSDLSFDHIHSCLFISNPWNHHRDPQEEEVLYALSGLGPACFCSNLIIHNLLFIGFHQTDSSLFHDVIEGAENIFAPGCFGNKDELLRWWCSIDGETLNDFFPFFSSEV